MKKVLIFHPTIAPYRIDFFNDLYKFFDAKIYLYYENLKDQKFRYEEITKNFKFQPHYFKKSIKFLKREIPVGFIKSIRAENPDIVIVNEYGESYWISYIYKIIFKKKYKIISICDDSAEIVTSEGGLHSKARILALKHIDGVILCNKQAEEAYKRLYSDVKTIVMPIIQDENNFFKGKKEIIDRAINIAKKEKIFGKKVYLYVGRISPEKNPLYLIKSFVEFHKKEKNVVLYVIGDNIPENQNYNDEIDQFIRENAANSYVRKIGRKEGKELKSWYYVGQCLIVPSIREPFGAVTNEALLSGNYIMISKIAGSTCLINNNNGEIIDVKRKAIDFFKMNKKFPLLSEEYILNKNNKMSILYRDCFGVLAEWINQI